MASFFWLTLVASFLALIVAFSKDESDGWDLAKVIYAVIIMIALIVTYFMTGSDPLSPNSPSINVNQNSPTNGNSLNYQPIIDESIEYPPGYESDFRIEIDTI